VNNLEAPGMVTGEVQREIVTSNGGRQCHV